jgi:CheY-like chemotaxis protein
MEISPATTQVGAVLSGVEFARVQQAERLLLLVPSLAEGTLFSADLTLGHKRCVVAIQARILDTSRSPHAMQRLAFWFARAGGWCHPVTRMSPAQAKEFLEAFDRRERSFYDVRPAAWPDAVRQVFATLNKDGPEVGEITPELRLHVAGTGWDGFTFDSTARLLRVPSPLAPCAGDVLRLVLECPEQRRVVAGATVVAVQRTADAASSTPAGFTLALDRLSADAVELLEDACPSGDEPHTRIAPRYAVCSRAELSDPGEALQYATADDFLHDYVTNLSHGGAFVRTRRPRRIGESVELRMELQDGRRIAISGTVVHRTEQGVGLQLALTPDVDAFLSAAVAGLSARPHRVLVVDDDALARGILVDALEERGFEVLTAPDGVAGLRAITDELFSLDAVVTDVHMPGLSGEALVSAVRTAGGESDLVLVVASASVDPDLANRLAAVGADRVVSKDAGAARVVAEVESALAHRASAPPGRTRRMSAEEFAQLPPG